MTHRTQEDLSVPETKFYKQVCSLFRCHFFNRIYPESENLWFLRIIKKVIFETFDELFKLQSYHLMVNIFESKIPSSKMNKL